MNTHWLVLSSFGWTAYSSEAEATSGHCANIKEGTTSYLVRGHTLDASGDDLQYELICESAQSKGARP